MKVISQERFDDAVQVFRALDEKSPRRARLRSALQSYLWPDMGKMLKQGQGTEGFERYLKLVALYRLEARQAEPLVDAAGRRMLLSASRAVLATYSPRGAVEEALTAVAVMESVDRQRRTHWQHEFRRILAWVSDLEEPLLGGMTSYGDAAEALEQLYMRWPTPFVRHTLLVLLARQYSSLRGLKNAPRLPDSRPYKQALSSLDAFDWQRLRLLTLANDKDRVARALTQMKASATTDKYLLQLVEAGFDPKAGPSAIVTLAEAFASRWPDVAWNLCERGTARFPADPELHYCLGSLAEKREYTLLALRHFYETLRANPDHRDAWERFAAVYLDRLGSLLAQERLDQVRQEVRFLEKFHQSASIWWPGRALKASLADAYFMLGRGLFNEGLIGEAITTLRKALRIKKTPQVYMQLAEIYFWRGRYEYAIKRFTDVHQHLKGGSAWRAYWELRTAPLIARTRDRLAQVLRQRARRARGRPERIQLQRQAKTETAAAEILRNRALQLGKLLLANFSNAKLRAEVLVQIGWIFFQSGRQRLAMQSFDAALDEAPNRAATYVDVISFLVMRGYFDEALDAYHRALARHEISEYLKAYCTFWILDLGRRAKVDPERLGLAEVFLKHLKGDQWYHHLALFVRQKKQYQELIPLAKTKGQRAELDFYYAMRLVRSGRLSEARRLWRRIVQTEMMAFFEYKMVRRYLERGAPVKPQPAGP